MYAPLSCWLLGVDESGLRCSKIAHRDEAAYFVPQLFGWITRGSKMEYRSASHKVTSVFAAG